MAIRGFGNTTSNLRLSKPAIRKEEEVETKKVQKKDEEKAANAQPKVVETGKEEAAKIETALVNKNLNWKYVVLNKGVEIQTPKKPNIGGKDLKSIKIDKNPEIELKDSHGFENWEEYKNYIAKCKINPGSDVVIMHDTKDQSKWEHFIVNSAGELVPVDVNKPVIETQAVHIFDDIEDFKKAFRSGAIDPEKDDCWLRHNGDNLRVEFLMVWNEYQPFFFDRDDNWVKFDMS